MKNRLFIILVAVLISGCSQSELDPTGQFKIQRVIDNSIQALLRDLSSWTIENDQEKMDSHQDIVLAGADDVWRRAKVVSTKHPQEISFKASCSGKLQFWACATSTNNKIIDGNLRVSVDVFDRKNNLQQTFQLSVINNNRSGWEKHEIPLEKCKGDLHCRFSLQNDNPAPSEETNVLIGSPVFVSNKANTQPVVILMLIDSLRARDTGIYGSSMANTPFLDEFSRHSVIYQQALSSSSWTMPSVRNLMSGQYSNRFSREGENLYEIREPFPVIQEVFSKANWFTAAISANHLITVDKGYERGFDMFDSGPSKLWLHGSSREIYTRTKDLLEENLDKPLFLVLHIMDPHDPYTPYDPFNRFCDPPSDNSVRQILHSKASGHLNFEQSEDDSALTDIEREYLHDYYRGEIRQTDTLVYHIVSILTELNILENSMILLTADHGEEFGEQGYYQHGKTLFEDSVRVPLMIKDFTSESVAAQIKPGWVSTIDIPETLSQMADLTFPIITEGMNIYPPEDIDLKNRSVFTILHHRSHEKSARTLWRSAYSGSKKIMWMNQWGYRFTDVNLYPADNFCLISTDPVSVMKENKFAEWRSLFKSLNEFMEGELVLQDGDEAQVDKKLRQKLRQLGYVK